MSDRRPLPEPPMQGGPPMQGAPDQEPREQTDAEWRASVDAALADSALYRRTATITQESILRRLDEQDESLDSVRSELEENTVLTKGIASILADFKVVGKFFALIGRMATWFMRKTHRLVLFAAACITAYYAWRNGGLPK